MWPPSAKWIGRGVLWAPRLMLLVATPLVLIFLGLVVFDIVALGVEFLLEFGFGEWDFVNRTLFLIAVYNFGWVMWIVPIAILLGDFLIVGCKLAIKGPYRPILIDGKWNLQNTVTLGVFCTSFLLSMISLGSGVLFFFDF